MSGLVVPADLGVLKCLHGRQESGSGRVPGEKEPKNKNLAILLALFTGFFVWAYTYQKDKWKFWITLTVTVIVFIAFAIIVFSHIAAFERAFTSPYALLEEEQNLTSKIQLAGPLVLVPNLIWILGVVDAIRRPARWYRNYPNG